MKEILGILSNTDSITQLMIFGLFLFAVYLWKKDIKNLDKDIKNLDKDIKNLDKGQRNILHSLVRFSSEVTGYINRYMSHKEGTLGANIGSTYPEFTPTDISTAQTFSPIALTPRGEKIAQKLQSQAIVDKYAKHILLPEDATKFATQDACFSFANVRLLNILNSEERIIVEDEIYEGDGNTWNILIIYGILFRDKIFKQRGIDVPAKPKE